MRDKVVKEFKKRLFYYAIKDIDFELIDAQTIEKELKENEKEKSSNNSFEKSLEIIRSKKISPYKIETRNHLFFLKKRVRDSISQLKSKEIHFDILEIELNEVKKIYVELFDYLRIYFRKREKLLPYFKESNLLRFLHEDYREIAEFLKEVSYKRTYYELYNKFFDLFIDLKEDPSIFQENLEWFKVNSLDIENQKVIISWISSSLYEKRKSFDQENDIIKFIIPIIKTWMFFLGNTFGKKEPVNFQILLSNPSSIGLHSFVNSFQSFKEEKIYDEIKTKKAEMIFSLGSYIYFLWHDSNYSDGIQKDFVRYILGAFWNREKYDQNKLLVKNFEELTKIYLIARKNALHDSSKYNTTNLRLVDSRKNLTEDQKKLIGFMSTGYYNIQEEIDLFYLYIASHFLSYLAGKKELESQISQIEKNKIQIQAKKLLDLLIKKDNKDNKDNKGKRDWNIYAKSGNVSGLQNLEGLLKELL